MREPLAQHFVLADEAATQALAHRLAETLPDEAGGWVIALSGELGAGKSTFARAMLRSMGHDGPVPSPTYTLVEPYELSRGSVYHVDLYRIADAEEIEYLGLSDLRDGLLLIEWPERAPALLELADIAVLLRYEGAGRAAEVAARSERAAVVTAALSAPGRIK